MTFERGFDFAELDPEAADLDLIVDPSEVLDIPRCVVAAEIAAAIHARLWITTERISEKFLGAQLRSVQIAARDPSAADEDLSRHADRHGLKRAVEQIDFCVRDRTTDRRFTLATA